MPPFLIAGALFLLLGLALVVLAALGARGVLRRNRWVGVKSVAALSSDASFAAANRAAAVPLAAAGAVALAGGAALAAGAGGALGWIVLGISILGVLALAGLSGLAGDRAAAAVTPPEPAPSACAGTCAGCDLVAGCRPDGIGTGASRAEEPASAD